MPKGPDLGNGGQSQRNSLLSKRAGAACPEDLCLCLEPSPLVILLLGDKQLRYSPKCIRMKVWKLSSIGP